MEPAALVTRLVAAHRELLRFVERRVGSRALAEDLLQDAFVRAVEHAAEIRDETAIAWFYRTLRHAVIDHHRRGGAAGRALDRLAAELADAAEPPPELRAAACACVAALADTLPPAQAEALRRIEVDGIAVKAFAEEAGITPGNAAVRVFRAREALRRQVARACGTCAEHGCLDCTCGRA